MNLHKKICAYILAIIMILGNILSNGLIVKAADYDVELTVGDSTYMDEQWVNDGVTSSNPEVAIAVKDNNHNGQVKITGVAEGDATISYKHWTGDHTVRVKVSSVLVTGLTLSSSAIDLAVGHTTRVLAKFEPENATNKKLQWTSADSSKVSVDPDTGVIKGVAVTGDKGVVVTATTVSGAGEENATHSASVTVRVGEPKTTWMKDTSHKFVDGQKYVFVSNDYVFYGSEGLLSSDKVQIEGNGVLANVANQLTTWTYSAGNNSFTFTSVEGVSLDDLTGLKELQYIPSGERLVLKGVCAPDNNPYWTNAPHYIALENGQFVKKQDSNGYSGHSYPEQYLFTVYKEVPIKSELTAQFYMVDNVNQIGKEGMELIGTETGTCQTAQGMRYDMPWYDDASWDAKYKDKAIAAVSVNGTLYSGSQLSNLKIYPGIDKDIKYYFYSSNAVKVTAEFYFVDSVGVITDEHLSTPNPESHHYLGDAEALLDRKTTGNLLKNPLAIFNLTKESDIYKTLQQKDALDYLYEVRSSKEIRSTDSSHVRQWIYAAVRSNANNYIPSDTHLHVDTANPPLNLKDAEVSLQVNELDEQYVIKYIFHKKLTVPIEYYYQDEQGNEVLLAKSYTPKENWTHICPPMFNQNPFVKGTGEKEFNLQGAQKTFSDQERLALMNRCMKFYVGETLIKTVNGVLDRVELTDDEADKFVGNDIKLKIYYSDPIKVRLEYYWPSGNSDSLTLQRTEEKTADSNSIVAISSLSQLNQNSNGLSKYHTHLYNANGEKIRDIPGVPDELQITEAGSTFTLHIHYVKAPEVTVEYYFIALDEKGQEKAQLLGKVNDTIVADVDDKVSIPDFTGYLDLSKVSVAGQPNWPGTQWPGNVTERTKLVDKYVRQYSPDGKLVWTTTGVPDEVHIVGDGEAFTLKVYFVNPAVPTSNVLQLPVTIRDFRGDGILFEYNYDSNHLSRRYNLYGVEGTEHPNGEGSERTTGLVENELRNGKIVYKEATVRYVAQLLYAGIYNDNSFERYTNIIGHIFDVIEEGKEKSDIDAMGSMNTVNAALTVDGEVDYDDIKDAYTAAYYLLSHMWDDDGVAADKDSTHADAYKEYNMIVPQVRAIQFQQYTDGVDKYYEFNSHEYKTVLEEDGIIKNTQNAPDGTPYDDLCYHPIDGLGYGNVNQDQTLVTSGADKLHDYNYLFTTMGQGQFVFSAAKNLYFEFNGDDDVYLFIDGKLVLDNGGAHQKENAIVYLNDINGTVLNLEEGKSYDFTFFHAERRSTGSHFHIKTNIEVMDSAVLTEKHVYQDKVDRIDGNVVDKDQPVVYGFEMINHGKNHVFHFALKDESLGIRMFSKGSTKECKFNGIADSESVAAGYATEVGQRLSNAILPGNIEITITELDENKQLFYPNVVRYKFEEGDMDPILGNLWPQHDINDNLIVDTSEFPTGKTNYGQFKETKLKDKFYELYGREGTQKEYEELLQEILLNGLEPTQRLLIKRFNRVMDANETYTNRVNTFATNTSNQKLVGTASITVRTLNIENRIFVIDYGKKVHFHEEQIFTDEEMRNTWLKLDVSTGDTPDWKIISENPVAVGKFGKATLGEEDNKTKYFQYELDRYMSASEAFKIGVESRVDESEPGTHETLVKTITMMPASNVYYEDDFKSQVVSQTLNVQQDTEYISQSGIVYQGNWRRVQIDAEGNDSDAGEGNITYQEGKETKGDNPYGYDTNYDNQTTFSDGTAWVADVSNGVARAYFEFQGNGFDLYSRTNSNTALIYVNLFQKQIDGSWKAIDLVTVDTLYKIGDLYQVPIVSYNKHNLSSLRYGTYRVQLMVMKKAANANEGTSARTLFYLDGIRIYNPAGTSVETEVEYAKNNEANATYTEIRDILLSAPEGDGVLKGNGAVFIDSLETETDGQIVSKVATYESFGPKNEVYLNDGKNEAGVTQTGAIAFGITYKEGMALQIGARSPENLAGNPSIQVTVTKNSDTEVQTEKIIPIKSTADMYYPIAIPEGVTTGDELTISIINNSGLDGTEIEKGDHFIALTKLKQSFDSITHTANTYSVTPETTQIATAGVKRFMLMRRMVNIPEEPEESQPEVPQPDVTQPDVTQPDAPQPEVSKPEVSIQEEPKPEVQQSTVPQQEVQQSTVSQTELQKPTVPQQETQQEIQQEEEKKPAKQQSEQQKTETKGFFRIILEFLLELLSNIKEWLGIGGEK